MWMRRCVRALVAVAVALMLPGQQALWASSHREAPLTALDEKADITDFYAFVSYDDPSKVTLIMNVDPLLEPGNGPNYFPFDPGIAYWINIDNNHDAVPDIIFEFTFETEIRFPGFTAALGAGDGIAAPANAPPPATEGTPIIPPAITALDGAASRGLLLRQTYQIKKLKGGEDVDMGSELFAVPSNVGPRTMPDYPSLARQGIYDLGGGVRVFAGTVEDPFYIDLGAAFDTFNLRQTVAEAVGFPGVLTDIQDTAEQNFAPDEVSGYNVNTIAIEVPITMITADGELHEANEPEAVIGAWATTRRPLVTTRSRNPLKPAETGSGKRTQIQRLGNPLVNELLIPTTRKDIWSRVAPRFDRWFANTLLDPLLPRAINAASAGALPIPAPPRTDLLPLVQYLPPICPGCTTPETQGPVADLLRLNTAIPPTPASERSRLGFLAGDLAGWPNGRRVSDDVTDIALRVVVGGVLVDPPFEGFDPDVHGNLGDGVNVNDAPYLEIFPYVGYAHSGRNSRHIDPGEPGCGDLSVCPVE